MQMSSWRRIRCPRTGEDYRAVLDSLSMICLYQQLGGVVPGTFFHGFLAARTHQLREAAVSSPVTSWPNKARAGRVRVLRQPALGGADSRPRAHTRWHGGSGASQEVCSLPAKSCVHPPELCRPLSRGWRTPWRPRAPPNGVLQACVAVGESEAPQAHRSTADRGAPQSDELTTTKAVCRRRGRAWYIY